MEKLDKVLSEHRMKKLDEPRAEHNQDQEKNKSDQTAEKRESLITLSQSGLLQKIGIKKSESQLISAKDSEIDKLYTEYQNRYTNCVTDSLTENILFGYSKLCKYFWPKIDEKELTRELSNNFIVSAEIKKQLGYFGMVISPFLAYGTIAVLTAKSAFQSSSSEPCPEQSPEQSESKIMIDTPTHTS